MIESREKEKENMKNKSMMVIIGIILALIIILCSDTVFANTIIIGGNTLSRGLTIEGLTTTYFCRRTGQMDTLMQMGRWFGYRSKYLDYCKIFTTKQIQIEYSALTESENDLWDQCYSIEKGELKLIHLSVLIYQKILIQRFSLHTY